MITYIESLVGQGLVGTTIMIISYFNTETSKITNRWKLLSMLLPKVYIMEWYQLAFTKSPHNFLGGDTGQAEDVNANRIDCRGFCDGSWVEDKCGYCNPPPKRNKKGVVDDPLTTSKYMDCAGSCYRPG